jgi:hypothetical protein
MAPVVASVVTPDRAPELREAVPSVRVPPWMLPEALILEAPAMDPVLVMPPLLLLRPPVTEAPPADTVSAPPVLKVLLKLPAPVALKVPAISSL